MEETDNRELRRMSSFERLMMSSSSVIDTNTDLTNEEEVSLIKLQNWWKRHLKLSKARR